MGYRRWGDPAAFKQHEPTTVMQGWAETVWTWRWQRLRRWGIFRRPRAAVGGPADDGVGEVGEGRLGSQRRSAS